MKACAMYHEDRLPFNPIQPREESGEINLAAWANWCIAGRI